MAISESVLQERLLIAFPDKVVKNFRSGEKSLYVMVNNYARKMGLSMPDVITKLGFVYTSKKLRKEHGDYFKAEIKKQLELLYPDKHVEDLKADNKSLHLKIMNYCDQNEIMYKDFFAEMGFTFNSVLFRRKFLKDEEKLYEKVLLDTLLTLYPDKKIYELPKKSRATSEKLFQYAKKQGVKKEELSFLKDNGFSFIKQVNQKSLSDDAIKKLIVKRLTEIFPDKIITYYGPELPKIKTPIENYCKKNKINRNDFLTSLGFQINISKYTMTEAEMLEKLRLIPKNKKQSIWYTDPVLARNLKKYTTKIGMTLNEFLIKRGFITLVGKLPYDNIELYNKMAKEKLLVYYPDMKIKNMQETYLELFLSIKFYAKKMLKISFKEYVEQLGFEYL